MKTILIILSASLLIVSCKKKGCIDKNSDNYDSSAKTDDGSCTYRYANGSVINMPYFSYDTTSNYEPELYIKLFKKNDNSKKYTSNTHISSFVATLNFSESFYFTNEDWTIQIWDNDPEDADDLIVSADFNPFSIQPTSGQNMIKFNVTKDNRLSQVTLNYEVK